MNNTLGNRSISVIRMRDFLVVGMPADPDDSLIAALQDDVLREMERHGSKAVLLDISSVETFDSFFARTVSETAQMVNLMGGRTIIVGMRPTVAITATQIGLTLGNLETSLNVDRALQLAATDPVPKKR